MKACIRCIIYNECTSYSSHNQIYHCISCVKYMLYSSQGTSSFLKVMVHHFVSCAWCNCVSISRVFQFGLRTQYHKKPVEHLYYSSLARKVKCRIRRSIFILFWRKKVNQEKNIANLCFFFLFRSVLDA